MAIDARRLAIPWSSVGVSAANSDNATALNALASNVVYAGDTVGNNTFSSQWLLKSNFTQGSKTGCRMRMNTQFGGSTSAGHITQTDLTTPLSNVTLNNLDIYQDTQQANQARVMVLYVNQFTLYYCKATNYDGLAVMAGNNHTITGLNATGGATAQGNPGWRIAGGTNHNILNSHIESGDAALQCSPVDSQISPLGNLTIDTVLFQDCYGASTGAEAILVGIANQVAANPLTCSVRNVTFRRITGSGEGRCILIEVGNTTGEINNVLVDTATIDASLDTTTNASVVIGPHASYPNSIIRNVTCTSVTITSPFSRACQLNGGSNIILNACTFNQARSGSSTNLSCSNVTGLTVTGNSIYSIAAASAAMDMTNCTNTTVTGNTFYIYTGQSAISGQSNSVTALTNTIVTVG